jgi:hypothetical protein
MLAEPETRPGTTWGPRRLRNFQLAINRLRRQLGTLEFFSSYFTDTIPVFPAKVR